MATSIDFNQLLRTTSLFTLHEENGLEFSLQRAGIPDLGGLVGHSGCQESDIVVNVYVQLML